MTRDLMDEVLQHCVDLGVDVAWEDLGRRRGEWQWWCTTIVLNRRLTVAQAVSTLVHELGHRKFGHTCSSPTGEQAAWEYGAAFLIPPSEYERAESVVGHHPNAIAAELGVTKRLVEAWQSWWLTKGQWIDGALLEDEEVDDATSHLMESNGPDWEPYDATALDRDQAGDA